jgi:hypothetical protein
MAAQPRFELPEQQVSPAGRVDNEVFVIAGFISLESAFWVLSAFTRLAQRVLAAYGTGVIESENATAASASVRQKLDRSIQKRLNWRVARMHHG